jgi:hypothetical protein
MMKRVSSVCKSLLTDLNVIEMVASVVWCGVVLLRQLCGHQSPSPAASTIRLCYRDNSQPTAAKNTLLNLTGAFSIFTCVGWGSQGRSESLPFLATYYVLLNNL